MKRIRSPFYSCGSLCDADLFLPDNVEKPPVIILAHGFGYPKFLAMIGYARLLTKNGIAAFVFDYRGTDFSEGSVKQIVDHDLQIQDLEAAIAYLRTTDAIDAKRIGLFSISYGAGHVLTIASREPEIKAVACLIPWVTPETFLKALNKKLKAEANIIGTIDVLLGKLKLPPIYLPMRFEPLLLKNEKNDDFYPGYSISHESRGKKFGFEITRITITDKETGAQTWWENQIPARSFMRMKHYHPVDVSPKINCPVLLMAGRADTITPYDSVKIWLKSLKTTELLSFDGGHFDADRPELRAVNDPKIAAFFVKNL